MANFDLGRVVPLYKGEYAAGTTYELNDVVTYNGSLYWHKADDSTTGTVPTDTNTWAEVLSLDDAAAYIARAEAAAVKAEEWATGENEGTPSATNNAKYYAEQASLAASAATTAKNSAVSAKNTANTAATNAGNSATAAAGSADAAAASAAAAATSAASIPDTQRMIAYREDSTTATKNYAVGDLVIVNNGLYRVTLAIATGETITPGTNVTADTVEAELKGIKSDVKDLQDAILLSSDVESHKQAQDIVRAGLASMFFKPGDVYRVNKYNGVSWTFNSSTITSVEVDSIYFYTYNSDFMSDHFTSDTYYIKYAYDSEYEEYYWIMNSKNGYYEEWVDMEDMGITITGTPSAGDVITVDVLMTEVLFEVLDVNDMDVPVDSSLTHTLPLLLKETTEDSFAYSTPQYLKVIGEDEFPNGLPVGTYYFTVQTGTAGGGSGQNGSYYFTTTQVVPVGGGIRHSVIGSNFSKSSLLNGKFTTYDDDGAILESDLSTTEGTTGTYLGTTSTYESNLVGSHINISIRQYQGADCWATSDVRMMINSEDAPSGSEESTATWWNRVSEFNFPLASNTPGFLYGLDPNFVAVICPVRKRTQINGIDGTGDNNYVDTEETVWIPSRTEMGLGATNGVYEGGVTADGVVVNTEGYALYRNASDSARAKGREWWLRSRANVGGFMPSYLDYQSVIKYNGVYDTKAPYLGSKVSVGLCIG